jgi:hypothetical protein
MTSSSSVKPPASPRLITGILVPPPAAIIMVSSAYVWRSPERTLCTQHLFHMSGSTENLQVVY